jgi:hypothetical protein
MEHDFLSRALALIENGYRIIPVRAGEKRPGIDEWQTKHATPGMAKKWANEFPNGNIGIITETNPAIDIDIYDAEMAEKMEAWCLSEFGATPIRVGRSPKRLLMYCTNEPFAKKFSTFADARGTKHKVEVLGAGQQFVALGVHPDTKQPFTWTSSDTPLNTPADMMPLLTAEMARAALAKYAEFAKGAGWIAVGSSEGRIHAKSEGEDTGLLTFKPTLKLTLKEITDALAYVDECEDYDRWIMVGMALHHQSRGHARGLELWMEWSSQAHNYDGDACESKWESFNENSGRHTPVTFASVLKIAHDREKAEKTENFTRALNILRTATNEEEIFGPIAKQLANAVTSDYQLDIVAKKMQDRVFEITEVKPRIDTVRKALMKASAKPVESTRPEWCDGWVYLKNGDKFFNINTKSELTDRGFNAVYNRCVLTEEDRLVGAANPGSTAAAMALNLYQIPTVDHTVYLPGFDKIVDLNNRVCANTFDETSVPPAKAAETEEEIAAVRVIENHFKVLFEDEVERTMVLDYFAFNVQHPADKIVWALVVQGAEGGGKTAMMKLLSAILGPQNVGPLSATELQDRFTGWAEGRKMVFIEEIRLHGSNRYEILDKMKEYVSNEDVTIRRMNQDSYQIPNVTNYTMFTNYWDGLPFSRMDRRYYVVATSFQTKEQLTEWNEAHPRYFTDVYNAIRDHADVLRNWFLSRKLSSMFQPKQPALDTAAKFRMRDESEGGDESDALNDVLEASTDPEVSSLLLNADKLKITMENAGAIVPYGRNFNTMLTKAGFHAVGRFRLRVDGAQARYYSRQPHKFKKGCELLLIREIVTSPPLIPHLSSEEEDPFA